MGRKLIYTQDDVGECTIADETEKWVTIVGQVGTESDAILFCAAPELLCALEMLILFTPRTKRNAVALHNAYAAINKALGETK
nr:MAG TPA: hypothetical protein [Caudoviricetes sp.]